MTKIGFGLALVLLAAAGSAQAADMAAPPPPPPVVPEYKAPPPVFIGHWTGFYVGVNAGYGWSRQTDTVGPNDPLTASTWAFPGEIGSPEIDANGFIGGGQIGYNWQFAPSFVAGVEADLAWSDIRGSNSVAGTLDSTRVVTGTEKLKWLGTVRGRLGFLPSDRLLVYATGGLAYGEAELSTALTRTTGCAGNNCEQGSISSTRTGWTAGAGLEWALAPKWTVKGEYLYYDLGSISHLMTDPNFPFVFNANINVRGSIARAGLNYRF